MECLFGILLPQNVQFMAIKLKRYVLIWWQKYQCGRERRGVLRVNTSVKIKLKLDKKFFSLNHPQTLYRKSLS